MYYLLVRSKGKRKCFPNCSVDKHLGVKERLIYNLEYKIRMLINYKI